MTFSYLLIVCLGGFIGAFIRYCISSKLNHTDGFPIGTLLVNLTGSLLIGVVLGIELSKIWTLLLASGLAGALTTFSTLTKELIGLWKNKQKSIAIIYLLVTFVGGIMLTAIGYFVFK